ncbi:DUF177 domain-containing protein [Clostridium sediminicola]|uniref:YceD family protein n=1 Tax=Clostridium sediminicola TaxID=3114879 RepID=UPI0031F27FFA
MIIDISDLTSKKVMEKTINKSFNCTAFTYDEEFIDYEQPVNLVGKFRVIGDIIAFEGVIEAHLKLTCSRCLEKFNYFLQFNFHEEFSKNEENDNEEIIILEDNEIDFSSIVENNIVLNLPIKKLCKVDCLGLCPTCGENLNKSSCNCIKDDIDPRFLKLKDFFSNN